MASLYEHNCAVFFWFFSERFVIVSYNILADVNARKHYEELYWHIRSKILDWNERKNRILRELGLWSPDIICLQVRFC